MAWTLFLLVVAAGCSYERLSETTEHGGGAVPVRAKLAMALREEGGAGRGMGERQTCCSEPARRQRPAGPGRFPATAAAPGPCRRR